MLVPKPYTGWQRQPMAEVTALKQKIAVLKRGVAALPNVSIGSISVRQAVWQTYISKGGSDVGDALVRRARGESLSSVLKAFAPAIDREVFRYLEGDLRWHFMTSAIPASLPQLPNLGL